MNSFPKTLLIGKNGQVGHDILPLLEKISTVTAVDRSTLDLTRIADIQQCVRSVRPDIIINAAAYTAVDKAESEQTLAEAINTTAPEVLGQEAARVGSLLVHYSTDYVFDGTKSAPYIEDDPICPINVYGATKAKGEAAIRHTLCRHLIFRTSWVFSDRGTNFLLTMLRLAGQRDLLKIVDDQIGAPTSSESLARATVAVLEKTLSSKAAEQSFGTYHMTAAGETSWFGFATEIFRQASNELACKVPRLHPIPSSEYATPARRPLNSRLSCANLKAKFGVLMPEWRDSVSVIIGLIRAAKNNPLATTAR